MLDNPLLRQYLKDDPNAAKHHRALQARQRQCDLYRSFQQSNSFLKTVQEEGQNTLCAQGFSLTLNPLCPYESFVDAMELCDDFSAHQILCATKAYYNRELPDSKKINYLIDRTCDTLRTKPGTLTSPTTVLSTLPGIPDKIKFLENIWEEEAFAPPYHADIWLAQWTQARATLKSLYKASFSQKHAQSFSIWEPSCPAGPFIPHQFLQKLKKAKAPYLVQHMGMTDISLLAYAWIPALFKPETRALFREIITRHQAADPEKSQMLALIDRTAKTFFDCDEGKTPEGFKRLIPAIWQIFDDLKAQVSQKQWSHCLAALKKFDGIERRIRENSRVIVFRHRTVSPDLPATKAHCCLKDSLCPLLHTRHTILLRQKEVLLKHKNLWQEHASKAASSACPLTTQNATINPGEPETEAPNLLQSCLLQQEHASEISSSTDLLFEKYTRNLSKTKKKSTKSALAEDYSPLQCRALLAQQSALLQSFSFMRCTLLTHFAHKDKEGQAHLTPLLKTTPYSERLSVNIDARRSLARGHFLPAARHTTSATQAFPFTPWTIIHSRATEDSASCCASAWICTNILLKESLPNVIKQLNINTSLYSKGDTESAESAESADSPSVRCHVS